MSTNPETSPRVSRWNRFPITYSAERVSLCFSASVITRRLSLNLIPDERTLRLELIEQLHSKGFKDKEIAEHLNSCGLRTPHGKSYYQELVFMTRRKFRLRRERQNAFPDIRVDEISFLIND
jgi:hypothetical protein